MATMILRGVVIRSADLRFDRDGGGIFCRLHLQADLSGPVLEEMGWDAIPDCVTNKAQMTGLLSGRTVTLTPNDKELRRHGFELECSDVSDFAAVPEKNEDGEVTGHRLNCIARSLEIGAISKVEQYRRLIGEGHAQATVAFEKQESLNFDAGPESTTPVDPELEEGDEPEGEVVHLASAVEVVGGTHQRKKRLAT